MTKRYKYHTKNLIAIITLALLFIFLTANGNASDTGNKILASQVVINELMAANKTTIADPQGDYDDWVELYNTGSTDVDLSGMYLSDKSDNLKKWQFSEGTVIKAGEYLIVWCDENSKATPGIHTNFKLSASGEEVYLVDNDANGNVILDHVVFGAMDDDVTFGRMPNGTGEFQVLFAPTPGYENETQVYVEMIDNTHVINITCISPNPSPSEVYIDIDVNLPGFYCMDILDVSGRRINNLCNRYIDKGVYRLNWNAKNDSGSRINHGVYFLNVRGNGIVLIEKIVILE